MFSILQLLLVVALIAGVIVYFGKIKKKEKILIAGLLIGIVLAAVIANGILSLVPLPTNEVVVTATGEKNDNAKNNEVNIINYIIGGEEYAIKNPTEGKWFWKGDVYMWRNENDSRQPAGTTRSITLNIPYGQDRSVQFGLSEWNGIVEVTYNGESNRYDLFKSGDETTILAQVPDTDSFALYLTKLLRLLLFAAIIGLLLVYPAFCVVKYEYAVIKKFWQKHWDKLVYACIAFGCFFVMFEAGKKGSLWIDDMWTIGWVYTENPSNSGIFFQALYDLWFYLMPYGQEYLLIISELLVAVTIYILGLIGSLYKSKRFGIIMAGLGAASPTIMMQCGNEFRPYALLLCSASLVFYFFIKKQNELSSLKLSTLLLYGALLAIYMDTHQFGLVTACFLMFFDFCLILRKKISKKALLEFLMPTLYGIYWLYSGIKSTLSAMGKFYLAPAPSIKEIINDIIWLCGHFGAYLLFILFILGICIIVVNCVYQFFIKKFDFKNDYIALVSLLLPLFLIFVAMIYSKYISPEHSLWIERYFVSIIVFLEFVIATAVDYLIDIFSECMNLCERKELNSITLTMAFVISICCIHWYGMPYTKAHLDNDYKGAAEYIMSENDVYKPTTLCYVTGDPFVNIGFEYYLTHKGERDSINHIGNLMALTVEDLNKYEIVYGVSYRDRQNAYDFMINNGFVEVYNNGSKSLSVRKWIRP